MNSTSNTIAVFVRVGDTAGDDTGGDPSLSLDLHFLPCVELGGGSQQSPPSSSTASSPTDGAMGSAPRPVGLCLGTSQSSIW